MIPKKVKIGGFFYDIEITDEPILVNNKRCYGSITYDQQLIQLAGDGLISEQSREQTFWHELIHAFVFERNLDWPDDKNELWTDELAKSIHAFCIDNNLKFEID